MTLNTLFAHITTLTTTPLAGVLAHQAMVPEDRKESLFNIDLDKKKPKKAAVLMLLYPKKGVLHLALIVRSDYDGAHASQIAFPGGKPEIEDLDLAVTATRETYEEIGVAINLIKIIRPFTAVYIPVSNFLVHPFLAYTTQEPIFKADFKEVKAILEVPLSYILNDLKSEVEVIKTSYSEAITVPVFKIQKHTVWGATAMMLNELKETLKILNAL
jgi:8-oxo-dGTP pyrophosphatase MutT (NUDIX family)